MLAKPVQVYLANFAVDMRKSINGLTALVVEHFDHTPNQEGVYYVFCNRARNRIKILYWDKNGFALWLKRLEEGRFQLAYRQGEVVALDADQLHWLLSGLDYRHLRGHRRLYYQAFI